MRFNSDNQRKAVFSNINKFSRGRVPNVGEIVYVPGDPSVGIFGYEGRVVGVHKGSADVQVGFGKDAVTEELPLEEFQDAIDIAQQKKFEEGLYSDWLDEQPTKKLVELAADVSMSGKEDKILRQKLAERRTKG